MALMSIIVAGTVSGDLSASQRIELHASAKVSGNLTAPTLVVQRVPCPRVIAPCSLRERASPPCRARANASGPGRRSETRLNGRAAKRLTETRVRCFASMRYWNGER
jgi:hypothetical protein